MKSTNTVPYSNAADAGRTHHGKIEIIDEHDPRHPSRRHIPSNRVNRRAAGAKIGHTQPAPYRRARSLRTLGKHPGQIKAAREALDAEIATGKTIDEAVTSLRQQLRAMQRTITGRRS